MVSLLAGLAVLLPLAAVAGPCAAPSGTRFEQVSALGEWEVSQIAALVPEGPARLYLSACGLGCVRGIKAPRPSYDVAMAAGADGVTLTLSDGGGVRGSLRFAWPESFVWFGADTGPARAASGSALYTEMRLAGSVTGTGDFALGGAVPAELVLSGFGNTCVTTRSFSGWSLSVEGPGASFRLFGALSGG